MSGRAEQPDTAPDGASSRNDGAYEVLTAPGPAAIAVVRAYGTGARTFLKRHVRLRGRSVGVGQVARADLLGRDGAAIDDILVSTHADAPTCDVRLHLHGSPWLVRHVCELLEDCGLQAAVACHCSVSSADGGASPPATASAERRPLWITRDWLEAEALEQLPFLPTLRGANWLLRQVELLREELPRLARAADARQALLEIASRRRICDRFRTPLRIALVGPPNAGKSTLANRLAGQAASLVSPFPGTTRDWIEIPGELNGFPVTWLDTAGLRDAADPLERAGVRQSAATIEGAQAVVVVLDACATAAPERVAFFAAHRALRPACVLLNKADRADNGAQESAIKTLPAHLRTVATFASAMTGAGVEEMLAKLAAEELPGDDELALPAAFSGRVEVGLRALAGLEKAVFEGAVADFIRTGEVRS